MFRIITLLSLFLAIAVIVSGAYVRLSDAGLGCPDWPGCFGQAVVRDDAGFKEQAEQTFPDQKLDMAKAWKEMGHRYVAGLLGLVVLLLGLLSWREKHCRFTAVIASISLIVLIGLQAALGMWTVTMKVMPVIVTSHLLMGLLTFWTLYWMYLRVNPKLQRLTDTTGSGTLILISMLLLLLQIFLGGWTSSNDAAMACTGFPQCNGSWWPKADYKSSLNIINGLLSGDIGTLSYDAQIAVHWMHRVGALVVLISLVPLLFISISTKTTKSVRLAAMLLGLLLLVQIMLGVANIKFGLPLWVAVAHNGIAALMMLPLIFLDVSRKYVVKVLTPEGQDIDVSESLGPQSDLVVEQELYVEPEPETLYLRLKSQLNKTRSGLSTVLASIPLGQKEINRDFLEEIESSLIMADVGIDATTQIIEQLSSRVERSQLNDSSALTSALKQELQAMLQPCNQTLKIPDQDTPFVILVVGVNGAGKTTTIGKLAKRFKAQGYSVMLAAGDTFRAAAVEQLQIWGERNNIHVVAQHTGADSASVIFDGLQSAKAKGVDVLIADTAGRLHTKSNLMEELKKIKRIMTKLDEHAPHEVLLVLDAGTGQNALVQTRQFNKTIELTGIALTKLDGTAKGGVIFALAEQFGIPIRYIGVGESIDDLQDFNAEQFIDALFATD